MVWFVILGISAGFIFAHGMDYVAWPRLVSLTDVIFYEGPGYRSCKRRRVWNGRGKGGGLKVGEVSSGEGRKRIVSGVSEVEMGTRKRID